MNFAKAALVLHNSTHVYSRKVDYLFNQVLEALKSVSMSNLQSHENKNKKRKGGFATPEDDEIDAFWEFDPHLEFLLLDDVLPVDNTPDLRFINLPVSPEEAELRRRFMMESRRSSTNGRTLQTPGLSSRRSSQTNNTLQSATTTNNTRMGSTVLGGGGTRTVCSSTNPSAWLGEQTTSTFGVCWLMNGVCELDESGLLILPGSQTRQISSAPEPPLDMHLPEGLSSAIGPPALDNSILRPESGINNSVPPDDSAGGFFDDGDENDGPGFSFNADNNKDGAVAFKEMKPRRQVMFAPDRPDPWALYDPHEPMLTSSSSRPLRRGKTTRLPPSLTEDKKTEKINTQGRQQVQKKQGKRSIAVEAYRHFMDPEDSNNPIPEIPWTGLFYDTESAELVRRAQAHRHTERRTSQRDKNYDCNNWDNCDADMADSCSDGHGNDMGEDDNYSDGDMGEAGEGDIESNTGFSSVDEMLRVNADEAGRFK